MGLLWRRRRDLHSDQIRAIEDLSAHGKYLLLGPPGSGKTSILLHRGQYLRLPPNNFTAIRLVTFTRTLREFIAVNGDDRFPPPLIQTVREFMNEIYSAYGKRPPDLSRIPFIEQNRLRAEGALELLNSGEHRLHFDALLVDEIQDLSANEVEIFGKLTERIMIVGDSRQRLFDAEGGLEKARSLPCEEIELKHHFRISRDICNVADAILKPGNYNLAEFCHYQGPTPSPPIARGRLTRAQQLDSLIEALDLQLDTYNDPEDLIGVIVARKDDCDVVEERLSQGAFADRTRVFHSGVMARSFEGQFKICIVTVQSCKGLEFRALHWLFADEDAYLNSHQRAYTVVTRAKSSLTVYHNYDLPPYLAGAFRPPGRGLFDDDD
jgi:superfamily I DNA/RNA helicase